MKSLLLCLTILITNCTHHGTTVHVVSSAKDFEDAQKGQNSTDFNRNSFMTVTGIGVGGCDLRNDFEMEFFQKGFQVVSEEVARSKIVLKDQKNGKDANNYDREISVENVKTVGSVFIFKFACQFHHGPNTYDSISATIVDLRTGRIAATVKYTESIWSLTSRQEIISDIVGKLSKELNKEFNGQAVINSEVEAPNNRKRIQ